MASNLSVIPTGACKRALLMDAGDNCVIALERIERGDKVCFEGGSVIALDGLDLGHKVAITDLTSGAQVIKHQAPIGSTTRAVATGEHLHTHNLKSDYIVGFHQEDAGLDKEQVKLACSEDSSPLPVNANNTAGQVTAPTRVKSHLSTTTSVAQLPANDLLTLDAQGYVRADKQVGIRNYVQIFFDVECASFAAREIAAGFARHEVQYFGFSGCYPSDYAYRVVRGMCTNPNVGAVLIVALGCENFARQQLCAEIQASGRDCAILVIQEVGGTAAAIKQGRHLVASMLEHLQHTPRRALHWSDLCVGTICGGSDGTSVITGNPAVGRTFDFLGEQGAQCIFEESGELIGCEQLMAKRAASPEVAQALLDEMAKCRRYYATLGLGSFSNGNAEGGLSTQEEKSLGAYAKSGSGTIKGIILPGIKAPSAGLYLMDVIPDGEVRFGYPNICDSAEACELVSCGCHLILFTTGRGSTIGSVIAPMLKVCNNPETFARMQDDMDVNAGAIISAGLGLNQVRDDILRHIKALCQGTPSRSEALGHAEFVLTYKDYDYSKVSLPCKQV